jgi:hypothetical protein
MTGKFLKRDAIIDTIKDEERTNAIQKRNGTRHPVRATSCGCPDENCGAFHTILKDMLLPTPDEAASTLKARKAVQREAKKMSRG